MTKTDSRWTVNTLPKTAPSLLAKKTLTSTSLVRVPRPLTIAVCPPNGHGSFGFYVYNYVAASNSLDALYGSNGVSSNILRSTLENKFTQDRQFTDHFLERGNFFRIDNITIGHTFNKLWNDGTSLRLSFAVQNVCTLSGYSGLDPELYDGIDKNIYQRPRTFMLGVNLNF